jgi:thymidylate synthase
MIYEDLLQHVFKYGRFKPGTRTGIDSRMLFGNTIRYKLSEGFPLITTKKVSLKLIATELLWFLCGETNVKWLQDRGCTIWDEWAREDGDLGPVYGAQWRGWGHPMGSIAQRSRDQISELVQRLKHDPFSRRHVVSAWNVEDLPEMALAPCHFAFQCNVNQMTFAERLRVQSASELFKHTRPAPVFTEDDWQAGNEGPIGKYLDDNDIPKLSLDMQVYQRSADLFLGVPFNLASYALLTHMLAQQCGYEPGELVWTGGDCHVYANHFKQVETQLERERLPLPKLKLAKAPSLFEYDLSHISLLNYAPHPPIKGDVAV